MHISQFLQDHVAGWSGPQFDLKCVGKFDYTTSIRPREYLAYARSDIESSQPHRHINGLSNAKRAIDCQVDNILCSFGLSRKPNFPQKMELLGKLGLINSAIVRKVVKTRNLLEHEYYNPTPAETEDAVDIASLFIEATSRPFLAFAEDYFVADQGTAKPIDSGRIVSSILDGENPSNGYTFEEAFYVEYDSDEKSFWIDCVHQGKQVGEIEICSRHSFYTRMVRFSLEYDLDHHTYAPEVTGAAFLALMADLANEI